MFMLTSHQSTSKPPNFTSRGEISRSFAQTQRTTDNLVSLIAPGFILQNGIKKHFSSFKEFYWIEKVRCIESGELV